MINIRLIFLSPPVMTYQELADKLAANVSQLIQEMITSQQSHLVTNTTKVQQGHDQMLGQVQTFGTSAASHINAAISYGDEGLAGLNKLTSENNTAVQDTMSQVCSIRACLFYTIFTDE